MIIEDEIIYTFCRIFNGGRMPTVIVEGPRASEETKKELVKRITEVVREVYGVKHVSIIIHEVDVENVGVDGELLSDILKKRAYQQ